MNAKTNDTTAALLLDNQLCFALYSALLKRLESAGLINRHRSRKDERQVAVTLSDAGRHLQQQASGIPHAVGCATQCDTETMLSLKQQLERLRQQIQRA